MFNRAALLLLCLPFIASAQVNEHLEDFSHVPVLMIGNACSVVTKGLVTDDMGRTWRLPEKIVFPGRAGTSCKGVPTREPSTLTVVATSSVPGAITATSGTLTKIATLTAGWLSVTNKVPATPGVPLEEQCQRAIHDKGRLLSYYPGGEVQNLVPILTTGAIDVYTNDQDFKEAVGAPNFIGSFSAHLYFVFRDEAARQQAIQSISTFNPLRPNLTCSVADGPANARHIDATGTWTGQAYKRNQDCAEVEGTAKSKISELKYLVMAVGYSPQLLDPRILRPSGENIPGPLLAVSSSDYIAPIRCTTSALYRDFQDKISNSELILTDGPGTSVPTMIGSEFGFLDACAQCTHWGLLTGDLTPLRTPAGFNYIHLDKQHTPFLFQVVGALDTQIESARQKSGNK